MIILVYLFQDTLLLLCRPTISWYFTGTGTNWLGCDPGAFGGGYRIRIDLMSSVLGVVTSPSSPIPQKY